jgi:8-oxo-dGTP diphosphatase
VRKAAFEAFRRLPAPVRRAAVHAGTPSYTVGAVIVLRRPDGQVLFVEQRHSEGWALPGGLLRRGEGVADAATRELAEEVGVGLSTDDLPVPLACVAEHARRVDVVYVVDVAADLDVSRADEVEVKRLGWFALDERPALTEPTVEILRAVRLL